MASDPVVVNDEGEPERRDDAPRAAVEQETDDAVAVDQVGEPDGLNKGEDGHVEDRRDESDEEVEEEDAVHRMEDLDADVEEVDGEGQEADVGDLQDHRKVEKARCLVQIGRVLGDAQKRLPDWAKALLVRLTPSQSQY